MDSPTTAEPVIALASASPRRAELLSQIGVHFDRCETAIDEAAIAVDTAPRERVLEVARAKAQAAAPSAAGLPVLAADTAVVVNGVELGKPADRPDAARMLGMLSNRSHWVYTAVVLKQGERVLQAVGETEVWFRRLSGEDIERYLDSGEPWDKAGAYGIQGRAAIFVRRIEGSYSNVVGLPLFETAMLLANAGINL